MITINHWPHDDIPDGYRPMVWRGDGDKVADAPAILRYNEHRAPMSIFRLRLDDDERARIAKGHDIFYAVLGPVVPFLLSSDLDAVIEVGESL